MLPTVSFWSYINRLYIKAQRSPKNECLLESDYLFCGTLVKLRVECTKGKRVNILFGFRVMFRDASFFSDFEREVACAQFVNK